MLFYQLYLTVLRLRLGCKKKLYVFVWEKCLQENEPLKPKNLEKILRKSPASNASGAIFKRADLS